MLRRLFTILSALSLLLCVATAVLWVRSLRRVDQVACVGASEDAYIRTVSAWTLNGKLVVTNRKEVLVGEDLPASFTVAAESRVLSPDGAGLIEQSLEMTGFHFAGFGWHPVDEEAHYRLAGFKETGGDVTVPFWFLAAAFAVAPLCWLRRRQARRVRGGCLKCGYDLRATPSRCPECGAVASDGVTP
jgi:hypothetical protein